MLESPPPVNAFSQVTIKTVFLDRDGIINQVVMRGSIVSSPRTVAEFQVTQDFPVLYESIRDLRLFVVSNQPDVERGLLDVTALHEFAAILKNQFDFEEIIYCTHDDSAKCACRKPQPGMILATLKKHGLEPDEAVIIGDSYKDILAGQAAGIRTIYCLRSYNSSISCEPDFVVKGLQEIYALPLFAPLNL
jgi:D-glycero-D-manno-heptose 1,7-bisphosphate phosphatase